jgi:hypothetical protein
MKGYTEMKWCNNCHIEYEAYVEKCVECGEVLMDETEYALKQSKSAYFESGVLERKVVWTAYSESEAAMVAALLEDHDIVTDLRDLGMGTYLKITSGQNYQGTEIAVKSDDAIKAETIIDAFWRVDSTPSSDDQETADYRVAHQLKMKRRRTLLKVILFVIWGLPLITMMLAKLFIN